MVVNKEKKVLLFTEILAMWVAKSLITHWPELWITFESIVSFKQSDRHLDATHLHLLVVTHEAFILLKHNSQNDKRMNHFSDQ